MREECEVKEVQEVKEVKEKSGGVAAFFDLDGTLVARPSLERRFFRMLRYRAAIPMRNCFYWLWEAARLAPRGIDEILRANKMYLRGLAADRMESGGPGLIPNFFGDGINRVAWHARQGHAVVLVSGTLEPLAEEVARALEAELAARGCVLAVRVWATRLQRVGGRWTGRLAGDAMCGEAKARAVRVAALEMRLDLAKCYAYGDSADDQWILEAVGRPVAVNPHEELARLARIRWWPVLHWGKEENGTEGREGSRTSGGKMEALFRTQEEQNAERKAGSPR